MSDQIAVVSVSGGKDSTATAILALDTMGRDRCRFVFADTGNEHPLTIQYLKSYLPYRLGIQIETVRADFSKDFERKRKYIVENWPLKHGVSKEKISRALAVLKEPTGIPFIDLCIMKGRFPSRIAQFCTQELKLRPLDAFKLDLLGQGYVVESWQGVRRDESASRKNARPEEMSAEGWLIRRPIVDWTASDVFDLMKSRGIAPNPLYSLGCSRVGCMPCINASKDEILVISQRWPEHIAKIREWESLVNESCVGDNATFFADPDRGKERSEGYKHMGIDARVEWARTSRGGKQFDFLRTAPPSECSSVYGLCE